MKEDDFIFKKYFIIIFIIFSIFSIKSVNAQTASFYEDNWIPNIFIKSQSSNFLQHQQMRFTRRNDGMFAYCIEHGAEIISSEIYIGNEQELSTKLNISKEQMDRIKAIAYYGYGYENHTDDKWYAITQVLIWKEIYPDMDIYYTDTFRGNRIEAFIGEEQEILNLVNNHFLLPSFNNTNITIKVNDKLTLVDTNNVLSNYEVLNNDIVSSEINGNNLVISALSSGEVKLKLKRKSNKYNYPILIWENEIAQDFLTIGDTDTIEIDLNIKSYDTKLEINKKGEDIKFIDNSYKYIDVYLSDVTFDLYADDDIYDNNEIKYKKNDLITTIKTDNNGNANISNLYYGKYKLVETKSNLNNKILDNPIYFELNDKNNNISLDIENKLDRKKLTFNKVDSKTGNTISNTFIEVYLDDNTLIYSGKTNEFGQIIIDDLFIGKYYIKEVKASDGYKLSDKIINFEITNNDNNINITMTNEIIEDVPNTYKNEYNSSLFIGIFFLVIGFYGIKIKKI